ncbi:B12-binding domain-containing protein [Nocardioides sp. zg-1228]|uniref:cobalamin B12-binding domain-containing protein n=1 Tax=Nocardioides sp. zg-1228 TaxID=2763008 RepID=UPI0016425288|nr:B12-binding domain-containing protein [Nocardioides sp. zg-1228]MBC2932713.1 B12-binding domain-containing protein [Nocardioides sp. zg-1228]QSF58192.1 B12-binding domain-containing protein [Nocardioides sp. zg-1228]
MDPTTTSDELWSAVETFDAEAAELAIARLLWDVPLSAAVTGVVLPFLGEVGDRWEAGTLSVAHEHFVSDMLRRKLTALTAVPPTPVLQDASAAAPVVLLACPPGERHDMVLLCVALMLRERGVRARFLGADTPVPAIRTAARAAGADAVVLAARRPTTFTAHASALRRLAADHPVYAAGRGADAQTLEEIGARPLPADPVRAVVVLVGELSELSGSW